MKSLKFNTLILLFILAGLALATANEVEVTKTFNKEFAVTGNSKLYIENRFGQVNIENWDKNSVSILVEVKVDHPDRDKAERILASISIVFNEVGDQISAVTTIDDRLMKSWNNFFANMSSKELSINYEVKLPKNLEVSLYNKYGDIFIDELTGKTRIELKYGNLKANRITHGSSEPLNSLILGYGNASIEEVGWLRAEIKYSKLSLAKAQALVAMSKYSKLSVDHISSIVAESKYDTYTIGTVSNFVGEGGYTTFRVNELLKKLDITTKYGDVKIERVRAGFESIHFNASYASLYAGIDPSASYSITGEASYGSIRCGSGKISRIESSSQTSVEGIVGSDANTKSKIRVQVKYGSATLR